MHGEFRHLRYGLKPLEPPTARHPRAAQRAAADAAAQKLGPGWRLGSRSHSRGLAAVAVGNAPLVRLGIDVEFADPARPWREIVDFYLPGATPAHLEPPQACRLWTFGEAYFKAFGETPSADLLLRISQVPPFEDEPVTFQSRCWWWSEDVNEGFVLSLVWEEAI
jgi:phosphopantetheinyl transferase